MILKVHFESRRSLLWDAAAARDMREIYNFIQARDLEFREDPRLSTQCIQALFKEIESYQRRGVQNPELKNLIEKIMQYKAELEPAEGSPRPG